ncbi:MAG: (Fe-S)-binding protein [Thermodesulfobacteriota bacterium]
MTEDPQQQKKCAKCGACTSVCPVAAITGRESHTPRGKLHLFSLGHDFSSPYYADLLAKCLQCRACDRICPRDLQPSRQIRAARRAQKGSLEPGRRKKQLVRGLLRHPKAGKLAGHTVQRLHDILPAASGLMGRLDLLLPQLQTPSPLAHLPEPDNKQLPPLTYYPGCLASHLAGDIIKAMGLLAAAGGWRLIIPAGLTCCGLAAYSSGQEDEARSLARRNLEILSESSSSSSGPIITSCASCFAQLSAWPDGLFPHKGKYRKMAEDVASRVQECSTFLLELNLDFQPSSGPQAVYYHDPCHLHHRKQPITREPRQLITAATNTPPLSLSPSCCGQGGLFHLANKDLSRTIFDNLFKKIMNLEPDCVVTSCSGCLLQWQQGLARHPEEGRCPASHLAVFLAQQLRY